LIQPVSHRLIAGAVDVDGIIHSRDPTHRNPVMLALIVLGHLDIVTVNMIDNSKLTIFGTDNRHMLANIGAVYGLHEKHSLVGLFEMPAQTWITVGRFFDPSNVLPLRDRSAPDLVHRHAWFVPAFPRLILLAAIYVLSINRFCKVEFLIKYAERRKMDAAKVDRDPVRPRSTIRV
jgi:hypothetical protein